MMTLSSPSVGRRDPDDDESETGKSNTTAFGQFSAQDFLGGWRQADGVRKLRFCFVTRKRERRQFDRRLGVNATI